MENQQLHFEKLIKESGHSTIHIILFNLHVKEGIILKLTDFGCGVNTNVANNYIVVDVPALISYYNIKEFLDKEPFANNIDYIEACISKQHKLSYS